MKLLKLVRKFAQTRMAIYFATGVLVVSLGLLCENQQQLRHSGGLAPGAGLRLPRCEFMVSSSGGSLNLLVQWGLGSSSNERNGLYFGAPAHRPEFHYGLHFNTLGFGFGFLPVHFYRKGHPAVPPGAGISVPFWFTSVASLGVILYGRQLRRRFQKPTIGNVPRKRFAYQGAENWLLTCLLMFATAELLWYGARFLYRYDYLEMPMSIPLFPPGMLLDFDSGMIHQRGLLIYAVAFWMGLFLVSLILSRKRINPAVPAGIILGLLLLSGFVLVFVAKSAGI